jgi:osmotically-inducible protein OsmY
MARFAKIGVGARKAFDASTLSPEMKKAIEEAVRSLETVREVTTEIVGSGNASVTSRGNDSLITSNVKTRMLGNGLFSPNHVKVVTEAGSVFLMGLVTPAEGDAAVEVARSTSGVSRVVKVFEYLPASAPKN